MNRKQLGYILIGLGLILAYWYSVHPLGFGRGYLEDWCHVDETRQLMAESMKEWGRPQFFTRSFMAPQGGDLPFMAWTIEYSWLGGLFWLWNRDFPFTWAYFGFSLVLSYLGVGWILRQMRLSPLAAWGLALTVVLFNIPRHYKVWHHYDHMLGHWLCLGLFMDALIWQRFWREKTWSWSLELWRGLFLLGMMGTAGYYWGPLILSWGLVKLSMLWVYWRVYRRQGIHVQIVGSRKSALFPVVVGALLVAVDFAWFLPLSQAVSKAGHLDQKMGWFGAITFIIRPLWLDPVVNFVSQALGSGWRIKPVNTVETVVTLGWFFWIPFLFGISKIRSKQGGAGIKTVMPFLILLVLAIIYITVQPPWVQRAMHATVPFMKFFRVASRWGVILPSIVGVMIALCWPELSAWAQKWVSQKPKKAWAWVAVFLAFSVYEAGQVVSVPVSLIPTLPGSAQKLLDDVRASPGNTVLDMPFCLTGGNGMCGGQQCPNYPQATVGGCFRGWHDKSVYGVYASRLVQGDCEQYNRAPYVSWFDAWKEQRCLSPSEWDAFCEYLEQQPSLAAVLVYPDIWLGAGTPACRAQFDLHLGAPIAEGEFAASAIRGDEVPQFLRVLRYGTRCLDARRDK